MKLKSVEIQGFKSFADRTTIRFDADVVSIVGPNGCGKSNIADAIRWAMGEQSTKRLRAQEMENIVFSGSDTRGPMSMAEVVLHFENDGALNHPFYGSCDEITVTRRYFRNQQTEYLINNVPCRLKDITELLSAAGASTRIYSVVEQGRIGWIVISKPEEKRTLIEEAAGVSVYKSRIASIERKMEKTQANLLRISDVIREMESNLVNLRKQAQKARRFKKYQDELMEAELYQASHLYLELLQKKRAAERVVEELKLRKEEIEARIATNESEMEVLAAEVVRMEKQQEIQHSELYAAQNELALLSASVDRNLREMDSLKAKVTADLAEIERLSARLSACHAEIAATERKSEDLRARIEEEKAALREVTARLESAKAAEARILGLFEEKKQRRIALASRIASLQARREDGLKNIAELVRQKAAIEDQVRNLQARTMVVTKVLDAAREETTGLEEVLVGLTTEKRNAAEVLSRLKEEIASQDGKIVEADERLLSMRSSLQSLQTELDGLRGRLKPARTICEEACLSLLSEKIKCQEGCEKAVSAVLGHLLGSVVVGNVEEALAWHLEMMGRGVKGVSFISRQPPHGSAKDLGVQLIDTAQFKKVWPLRSKVIAARDVSDLVDRLLANVYLAEDISTAAAIYRQFGGQVTLVTRDGEVLTPQGALLAAQEEGIQERILALEAKIASLSRMQEETAGEREAVGARRDELRSTIKTVAATIEEIGEKIHETEKNLIRKREEVGAAASELSSLEAQLKELEKKGLETVAKMLDWEREAEKISESIPALTDEVRALDEAERAASSALEETRRTIEEMMIFVGARNSSIESLTKQEAEVMGEVERLRKILLEYEERSAVLEAEISRCAESQGRKLAEIFLGRERLKTLTACVHELTANIDDLKNRLADWKFKVREKEVLVRSLRKQAEETEKECFAFQTSLIQTDGEIQKIVQNVELRWRRHLEEEVYSYHNRPVPDASLSEKIDELQRILERMGPVNLLAIEDYQKMEEKYQFYMKEKTDLEEAMEKFEEAISRMNREYKRKFIEAFNAVNENFRQIFQLLFCGGHGYLELVDPSKILETGVEIKAKPPGKKLGNLDMMSGGEKALTAIALIFAIFKYRPSPFCILDEVDAPLDEANVKRFNDMLRTMTDRSQFILMTHSKLTMQCSDILYGVTMEEPGISKIISTKIRKAAGMTAQVPTTAVA